MDEVPPVDAQPEPSGGGETANQIKITNRLLDAEAKAREHANRETDQRYYLRYGAVLIAILLMAGMGWMLAHVSHHFFTLKLLGAPSGLIVAMFVAPIISLTTISLSLLVAAFRGYKDGDQNTGMDVASNGMKAVGLLR